MPTATVSLFNTALTAGFAAAGQTAAPLRDGDGHQPGAGRARRSIIGDLEAVRVAVEMTHDYMNLGLEHLAGGDLKTAIEHLRDTHLQQLFRLGVSLTIDLRKRAETVVAKLGLATDRPREIPYLDPPYREAIAGFMQRQPQFFGGLDRGGSVVMRDFRSMRDLHLGHALLEQVDAIPDLFKALLGLDIASPGFRAQIAGYDIRLSQILLTALARYALDGRLAIEPIEAHRLEPARAAIMTMEAGRRGSAKASSGAWAGLMCAPGRTGTQAQRRFPEFLPEYDRGGPRRDRSGRADRSALHPQSADSEIARRRKRDVVIAIGCGRNRAL